MTFESIAKAKSKAELVGLAKVHGIPGRTRMTKAQLVEAIARTVFGIDAVADKPKRKAAGEPKATRTPRRRVGGNVQATERPPVVTAGHGPTPVATNRTDTGSVGQRLDVDRELDRIEPFRDNRVALAWRVCGRYSDALDPTLSPRSWRDRVRAKLVTMMPKDQRKAFTEAAGEARSTFEESRKSAESSRPRYVDTVGVQHENAGRYVPA